MEEKAFSKLYFLKELMKILIRVNIFNPCSLRTKGLFFSMIWLMFESYQIINSYDLIHEWVLMCLYHLCMCLFIWILTCICVCLCHCVFEYSCFYCFLWYLSYLTKYLFLIYTLFSINLFLYSNTFLFKIVCIKLDLFKH